MTSIEQALEFLAKLAQDAGLGDVDGVGREAHLGADVGGREVLDDDPPECGPGALLELGPHQVEGLLSVVVQREEQETKRYSKPGRPGEADQAQVEVEVRYRIS